MHLLHSPQEAYRKVDFDARVAGADPVQLVLVCYEQLASALGTAVHADARGDNSAKSASLTRALSALTALQMGLDHDRPIAGALASLFAGARKTVLDSVLQFDAVALAALRSDVCDIADAFRANAIEAG
jgi:flagellar protein FliS